MSLSGIFPDEIVQDVLVGLPSKSLVRFRCVSKPWLSVIHDPTFVRSHLDFNTHRGGATLVHRSYGVPGEDISQVLCNKTLSCIELDVPLVDPTFAPCCTLVGSIDGLLFLTPLSSYGRSWYLYNPSIQRFRKVYDSCFFEGILDYTKHIIVGLGFCENNDYRILRVLYTRNARYRGSVERPRAEIYSVRSDSWTVFRGDFPKNLSSLESNNLVVLNGRSHWLEEESKSIVTFDFEREVFGDVLLPNFISKNSGVGLFLNVIKGKLALIVCNGCNILGGTILSIWGMMEYGVVQSWTKLYEKEPPAIVKRPLGFTLENDLILELIFGDLIHYDLEREMIKDIFIRRRPETILNVVPYVESLVFYDEGITRVKESLSGENREFEDAK